MIAAYLDEDLAGLFMTVMSDEPSWRLTELCQHLLLTSRYLRDRHTSGMNQMHVSCRIDGTACTTEGMRHAQLSGLAKVPSVTPAAMMAPAYLVTMVSNVTLLLKVLLDTYQDSLNNPLMTEVWDG
jgi:hypothetical protein